MLEKLFLASILTFSFGLFADIGWFENQAEMVKNNSQEQIVSTLVRQNKQINIDADTKQ